MRFKTDENLPQESIDLLTQAKHDAVTVVDQQMGGGPNAPKPYMLCKVADEVRTPRVRWTIFG